MWVILRLLASWNQSSFYRSPVSKSDSLKKLGRIHSPRDARSAVEQALNAGFDSVNVDMMFGLPDQTIEEAMQDLDRLIRLGTEHISWYQLTLEPNTVFGKRPPKVASDDDRADMSDAGLERLAAAGYRQYEVSAFAIENRRLRVLP